MFWRHGGEGIGAGWACSAVGGLLASEVMKSPLLLSFFVLLSLALGVVSLMQYRELAGLRGEAAVPSPTTEVVPPELVAETENLRAQLALALARIDELEAASVEAAEAKEASEAIAATEAAESARQAAEDSQVMQDMFKLIEENPALNDMIAVQQRGTLEYLYGDLIARFGLSGEEKTYFLDLLLARQMEQVSMGLMAMGGESSPEARAAAMERMRSTRDAVRAEMETFLNSKEDYEAFTYFEDTMNERMAVDGFAKVSAQQGAPVDDATYDQIVDLMYRERQNYPFTHDFSEADTDLSGLTPTAVDEHLAELKTYNQQIADLVATFLTPAQLELFVQNQEQMRQMQAAGLQMAAKMFGAGEGGE